MICDVEYITDNGKAFRTRWKITGPGGGSPSDSGYKPEDEANDDERSRKKQARHDAIVRSPQIERATSTRVCYQAQHVFITVRWHLGGERLVCISVIMSP